MEHRFNLVANPYPSYLNVNSNAGSDNILTTNLSSLEGGTHQSICALGIWLEWW